MEQEPKGKVKTKVRFTSLDTAAMVAELQGLVGMRITNIYDISPTTYLLKFTGHQQKTHLLVQNGVRFHTTPQNPDKLRLPSGFTMRFRKYLRSKRLEGVRQVGVERVVVLSFGSDAFANHLILELYSQGNIVLTDQHYRILQCIRSHQFSDNVKTAVGELYPFEHAANIYLENIIVSPQTVKQTLVAMEQKKTKGKEQQAKAAPKLKDVVFQLIPCLFPQVIEHVLTLNQVNLDLKVASQEHQVQALQGAKLCLDFLVEFLSKKQKGHLYSRGEDYFEFSPFQNCKLEALGHKETSTFDEAVSEYFSKYKRSAHEEEEVFEELAWKKYEQIRKDQEERVQRLMEEQESYGGKAQLIEKNIQDVEAVLKIIGTMESNGYSWEAMDRMIADSRKAGDPLANIIHTLNPVKRQVTVLLSDNLVEEPDLAPVTPVELQVDYNAYTNATLYYQGRKKQQHKESRTREASEQVLKLAEKDALRKIEKKKNEMLIKAVPTRKQLWFEKFYWFLSNDGWLVLSGRDSHQNELLVKRYMKSGDLYMHSDYGGAASTVIKGQPKAGLAPLSTLEEAAIFTVCRSKAWDTKIISSAWWVYHDQVSKSAPTGEYLPTGSFMIRGKRNFLHPNRMEMGFTLLYRLDNESAQRRIEHKKELQSEAKGQQLKQQFERVPSSQTQEEQYAIIDLEAEARQAREKKKEKNAKAQKQQPKTAKQPQLSKQSSQPQKEGSSDSEEEESEEEEKGKKFQDKKEGKKTKKGEEEKEEEEPGQKHKNRNKKKMKKLEKYMEEQDEDERRMIMKMLGAKEMKHLQPEDQKEKKEEEKKEGKKQKKKGLQKYIDMRSQLADEAAIDTEKVLFLKQKDQPEFNKKEYELQKDKKKGQQSRKEPVKKVQEEIPSEHKIIAAEQKIIAAEQRKTTAAEQKKTTAAEQKTIAAEDKKSKPQSSAIKPQDEKTQGADEKGEKGEVGETVEKEQINEEPEQVDSDEEEEEKKEPQIKLEQQELDEKVIDSELLEMQKLVGRALNQDKWQALIPMCAPYSTIKDNAFKVKLLPGPLKKGKAARNIMGYFLSGQLQEGEKAFLRALPEQEIINAVIGNVKLGGAGMLKLQQKARNQKKEKRREQDRKAKAD